MNEKHDKIRLALYALVFLAVLIYPVSKILKFEWHKGEAAVLDFRVAVYDPYDPFRGNYVRLQFDVRQPLEFNPSKNQNKFLQGQDAFVVLEKNSDGFAKISSLESSPDSIPAGKPYLHLTAVNGRVMLPFDKFFLNEELAPETEKVLQDIAIVKFLRVRIYPDGTYAVDDLYVNGTPVREYMKTLGTTRKN